jgi:hypothetical protein
MGKIYEHTREMTIGMEGWEGGRRREEVTQMGWALIR